ncbi:hypothetical protein [Inmirania thermothiophila]|uniref:DUF1641 domain-containing protein n=1 Tax=Inmirania thermothiophila TaxID=1750597 RepID=A0A3N1Y507_9GAMM|nr:hypothetical protein [Inmirania thermothiophila]ROR32357.1 hypothetical protein EDC57_1555 [Inmirania thermothiophila]
MNDTTQAPPAMGEELERLARATTDALTDSMVERAAVAAGNAMEVLDRLNDEQTRAAIHALLDGLTELHRLGALQGALDLVRLLHGAREALTDSMVERLVTALGNLGELADLLNDEVNRKAMAEAIQAFGELHRLGATQTLFDLVRLVHAARDAATDSMVERGFVFIEQMVNNLANEEMAELAHQTRRAMEEALEECVQVPAGGGLLGTVRMLANPEAQSALRFLLAFGCRLQQRAAALTPRNGGEG